QNRIIPNDRRHYLLEIADHVRKYHENTEKQSEVAERLYQLHGAIQAIESDELIEDKQTEMAATAEAISPSDKETILASLKQTLDHYEEQLNPTAKKLLDSWDDLQERYSGDTTTFRVRDKEIQMEITTESL